MAVGSSGDGARQRRPHESEATEIGIYTSSVVIGEIHGKGESAAPGIPLINGYPHVSVTAVFVVSVMLAGGVSPALPPPARPFSKSVKNWKSVCSVYPKT